LTRKRTYISPDGTLVPFGLVEVGTVTIRPQAAAAIDIVSTPKPSRRISLSSPTARAAVLSACCAFALHLAFPRTSAWWLVPLALTAFFRMWWVLPPLAATLNGYLGGLVFFTLSFAWFGETAGALLGPFGFVIDLLPALAEALAFAAAALCTSLAARRAPQWLAPAIAAGSFTAAEWVRSSGLLAVPFGQLGLPLVDSPLRPLAAYVGGFGLTFAIALVAAYVAAAWAQPRLRRGALVALATLVVATGAAWPPGRHAIPRRRPCRSRRFKATSRRPSKPPIRRACSRTGATSQ
jgi:apolipoprotein N-acyltransferase